MSHQQIRRVCRLLALVAAAVPLISCNILTQLVSDAGSLEVEIEYTDVWYRETFGYTRQAENIRHFVLVVPESEAGRAGAAEIFTSLRFPTGPGELSMQEDRAALAWALDYLHEAPGGYFAGQFAPGTYYVAVAFIAAPIDREEAGHSDDTTLYPGITGGGASTDYEALVIEAGVTRSVKYILTDANGWACPWLYVYDGRGFIRSAEILRNLRGEANERTETSHIGPVKIVDGKITFKVAEEKRELSFIDEFYIIADGVKVPLGAGAAQAAGKDQNYLVIAGGESYEFSFDLPGSFAGKDRADVWVVVTGFYIPGERQE
ncbi:MAG: hypothetical protein JXB47_19395 [Anaerolineae bacterium]|nr:hypothetical protein [Anaerolineae bacterium]